MIVNYYDNDLKRIPHLGVQHIKELLKTLKKKIKFIPCLCLADPIAVKIVETDLSQLGFGEILKQVLYNKDVVIRYYLGL